MARLVLILLLTLSTPAIAVETIKLDTAHTQTFLNSLIGNWSGRAVETPVGQRDYHIEFKRCSDGSVVGVANTGASLHYWRYSPNSGNLRLHFMSTFGGNQTPVILEPSGFDARGIDLHAPHKKLLTLRVNPGDLLVGVQVYHHQRPHVRIELKRSQLPEAMGDQDCTWVPKQLLDR